MLLTVFSDLADAFPGGEFSQNYRQDWLLAMIRSTRSNRENYERTTNTARWAREQVRLQMAGGQNNLS